MILNRAARLFTWARLFGSAMSDVMAETGLEKGGLYNHFESKEDLALQAFDYAVGMVRDEITKAVTDKRDTVDRLLALMGARVRQRDIRSPVGVP